jgi:hypothetical protein
VGRRVHQDACGARQDACGARQDACGARQDACGARQEAFGEMLGDLKRDLAEVEKRVLDLRGHL